MFAFATDEENENLCSKKKKIGLESYSVYALRVVTSLNYYLSMYFIQCMKDKHVTVPKQLTSRRGMTFPTKMIVSNIGTYKGMIKKFDLDTDIGKRFRIREARRRNTGTGERDV